MYSRLHAMRWISISIPRTYRRPTLTLGLQCSRQPRSTFTSTTRLKVERWTLEEVQYALRRSRDEGASYKTVAAELGRTYGAIQTKLSRVTMEKPSSRSSRFNEAWTAAEDQTIVDGLNPTQNGGSGRAMAWWRIAKSLGRSEDSVRYRIRLLRKTGQIEQAKSRGRPFTPAEDQEILSLTQAGISQAAIARTLNRGQTSVAGALQRLQTGPLAARRGQLAKHWSSQELNTLTDRRNSGCSFSEIAQSIGRSSIACQQKYRQLGNPQRTQQQLREWTSDEDAILVESLRVHRLTYQEIASTMPRPRSPGACRMRWTRLRRARGKA